MEKLVAILAFIFLSGLAVGIFISIENTNQHIVACVKGGGDPLACKAAMN